MDNPRRTFGLIATALALLALIFHPWSLGPAPKKRMTVTCDAPSHVFVGTSKPVYCKVTNPVTGFLDIDVQDGGVGYGHTSGQIDSAFGPGGKPCKSGEYCFRFIYTGDSPTVAHLPDNLWVWVVDDDTTGAVYRKPIYVLDVNTGFKPLQTGSSM